MAKIRQAASAVAAFGALGLSLAGPQALGVASADTSSEGSAASVTRPATAAREHRAPQSRPIPRRTPHPAAAVPGRTRAAKVPNRPVRAAAVAADPATLPEAAIADGPAEENPLITVDVAAEDNTSTTTVEEPLTPPDRGLNPLPWWRGSSATDVASTPPPAAPPVATVTKAPAVARATAAVKVAQLFDRVDAWLSGLSSGPVSELLSGALLLARRNLLPNVGVIPKVSVTDSAVTERDTGAIQAVFIVSLDQAYKSSVTVGYRTGTAGLPGDDNVDAAAAGTDYTAADGLLTFTPGQTSQQITVSVLADDATEKSEQFSVRVFATVGTGSPAAATKSAATAAPQVSGVVLGTGLGTIFNDDIPVSVLSSNVDLSNWMSTLPGVSTRPLTSLPIPGTHDSGTYSITSASPWARTGISDFGVLTKLPNWLVKPSVANWAKAQPTDLFQQFTDGIRYVDLRLSNEPDGTIYIEHGLRGPSIDEVLADINRFADARPGEVLFIDMARFTDFTDATHAALVEKVRTVLGPNLVDDRLGTSASLQDIRATGRNVVLIYKNGAIADASPDLWPADTIEQPWPNVQTVGPLLEKNREYLAQRNPARIWGLSGTVTPDTGMIVKGLWPSVPWYLKALVLPICPVCTVGEIGLSVITNGNPTSLESLMKQVHPAVQDWLRGEFKNSINLVTTDWYNAAWTRGSYVRDVLGSVDGAYL